MCVQVICSRHLLLFCCAQLTKECLVRVSPHHKIIDHRKPLSLSVQFILCMGKCFAFRRDRNVCTSNQSVGLTKERVSFCCTIRVTVCCALKVIAVDFIRECGQWRIQGEEIRPWLPHPVIYRLEAIDFGPLQRRNKSEIGLQGNFINCPSSRMSRSATECGLCMHGLPNVSSAVNC